LLKLYQTERFNLIKIGIDIVVISRIEKLIKKYGLNLKFLNEDEKYTNKPESIAGIFAAKEAFSKAIGSGIGKEFSFKDISILKDKKGKPFIKLNSPLPIKSSDLSITHDGGFAIAAVIVEID